METKTMIWTNYEEAGFLPDFVSDSDPRDAVTQLNEGYAHGGGWHEFSGFKLCYLDVIGGSALLYPGDPPMKEKSRSMLRNETIILFQGDWVAVVQTDGSFRTARMD
jgi:hypothetical protein